MATATALLLFVERGVDKIDVFLVHFILGQSQTLAKPLEVDDLSGPEKFDDIVYIRIIGVLQTKVNRKNEKSPVKFTRPKMGITKQAGEKSHRQPG